jgi:predicted aldo/keto reductase-like oxidoreductase
MESVELGKGGPRISRLSMGCGRLPENDEDSTALIRQAVAAGINYFETATFYCNNRCLEKTGLGLRGLRDRVMIQVKIGTEWDATADSVRREAESQMQRLGVDRVDFYQFGWLAWERMPVVLRRGGPLEGARRMLDEGLARYLGFTGHDTADNFIKILETGLFGSMTVSYNLLNRAYEKAIARAHELGVGVIVMNPVGGGMLGTPSETLRGLIPGGPATTAEAALRFVLSTPGVTTACSGMSTPAQLAENLATAARPPLGEGERAAILGALDRFKTLGEQFCTGCKYCLPCPHGVDIPGNFGVDNYARVYGLTDWARGQYAALKAECRADQCTECGECEPKCPQKIPIREQLAAVAKRLAR